MENIVLIDTNLYLDDANIIYKLSDKYEKILIPITVLKELDSKKYHKDLSYSARNAIQAISNFYTTTPNKVIFDTKDYHGVPDDRILSSAKRHKATVATKDISMSIQAKSLGLESMLHDVILNNIFDPYIHIHMNDLNKEFEDGPFSYGMEYPEGVVYDKLLKVFSKFAESPIDKEQWWFVIIDVNKKNPMVYANNPMTHGLVRIDNVPKYRKINNKDDINVKARDCYQVCAMYAMIEAPNVLICGSYGSGKSLLSSAYAISYNSDRKTFISRPNLTVDKRFELGFLPGMLEEKLLPWMAGFISSLYFMYSNTRTQRSEKGKGYDYVKDQIFKQYFEMTPLDSIQGMSFMKGDLLLLDETQLCTVAILATILSRFGEGSKLIMTGDVKQTYGVIPPSENGLLKLLRQLPNKNLAYVQLKNNYRSDLIEVAAKLQDKTF